MTEAQEKAAHEKLKTFLSKRDQGRVMGVLREVFGGMTQEAALAVLDKSAAYYSHDEKEGPAWYDAIDETLIVLDGDFSREQLLALLAFHPEAK